MNPWQVPVYLPYLQPSLTPAAVAKLEARRGVVLPPALVACLAQQNGGYLRMSLEGEDFPHRMIWGIGPHFPNIGRYHEALDPVLQADCAAEGIWMPADSGRLLPFDGDGHWYLCLDYRVGPRPAVSYIDVEIGAERRIADTFEGYPARLRPDLGTIFLGLRGVASVDEVARRLEAVLPVVFGPADAQAHGYPVRRGAMPSDIGQSWIWLSPNRVPRGFVRPGDSRHDELKDLLPGDGWRMPEHPEVVVFAGCTEAVRRPLVDGCRQAGMDAWTIAASTS